MSDDDYNTKEKIVQTEKRFEIEVRHKRGSDVRDEDSVSVSWSMEKRPPQSALVDLTNDVRETMHQLRREEEEVDDA